MVAGPAEVVSEADGKMKPSPGGPSPGGPSPRPYLESSRGFCSRTPFLSLRGIMIGV